MKFGVLITNFMWIKRKLISRKNNKPYMDFYVVKFQAYADFKIQKLRFMKHVLTHTLIPKLIWDKHAF